MDLNLLIALDALLAEGSVTKAARKVGLSQPAMSHTLSRLRVMFDDPLLVRSGREMLPTPRAEALREPLKRWLAEAQRLIHQGDPFAPETTKRTFRLLSPDLIAPLLAPMMGQLQQRAPQARLEVIAQVREERQALTRGEVDLLVGPPLQDDVGLMMRSIHEVHWGLVARQDHPIWEEQGEDARREGWLSFPHVLVRRGHGGKSIISDTLTQRGWERQIGLVCPSFLSALLTLTETELLMVTPQELVRPLVERFGLRVEDAPLQVAPVPLVAIWHERDQADQAHRFFRELVVSSLQSQLQEPDLTSLNGGSQ